MTMIYVDINKKLLKNAYDSYVPEFLESSINFKYQTNSFFDVLGYIGAFMQEVEIWKMEKEYQVLYEMAMQLRNDVGEAYNRNKKYGEIPDYSFFQNRYNILARKFNEHIGNNSSVYLDGVSISNKVNFEEVYQATGQLIAGLKAILNDPLGENKVLKKRIETLEKENKGFQKEVKQSINVIEKFVHTEEFNLDLNKIREYPSQVKELLIEAGATFKNGTYIACCTVCGVAFESIIKELCIKNEIKYSGLSKGISSLKEQKILKKEHFPDLMKVAKYYRDKAEHPTSEVFNKDKAKWFLSSLLILCDELF